MIFISHHQTTEVLQPCKEPFHIAIVSLESAALSRPAERLGQQRFNDLPLFVRYYHRNLLFHEVSLKLFKSLAKVQNYFWDGFQIYCVGIWWGNFSSGQMLETVSSRSCSSINASSEPVSKMEFRGDPDPSRGITPDFSSLRRRSGQAGNRDLQAALRRSAPCARLEVRGDCAPMRQILHPRPK